VSHNVSNARIDNAWLAFIAVAGAIAAVVLFYWPAMESLAALWLDTANTTFTHGFLVAATLVWVLWFKRNELMRAGSSPVHSRDRILACVGLFITALVWQLAYRAGVQLAYLILVPVLLTGVVSIVFGFAVARECLIPFGLLYFAIPIWDYFNPVAQQLTVYVVRFALRLVGVPAHFVGSQVQLPSGVFEIQGSCSGLHFLMVGLMLATLIGELRADGWRMRLRWLALGLGLALLTNWIRVFTIIVIGHLTYMQNYLVRVSHYGYGWVLFAIAASVLLWIEHRVPLAPRRKEDVATATTWVSVFGRGGSPLGWPVIALAILALPMILNSVVDLRAARNWHAETVAPLPSNAGDWIGQPSAASRWKPAQPDADVERRRVYTRNGESVEAYGAWYRDQGHRKKLGGFGHRLSDGDVSSEESMHIGEDALAVLNVVEQGRHSLIVYRYVVGDRRFTSALSAQLWYAWNTVSRMSSPVSGVVALRAECAADCSSARQALSDFSAKAGDSWWRSES
jgi:EpsI family protein